MTAENLGRSFARYGLALFYGYIAAVTVMSELMPLETPAGRLVFLVGFVFAFTRGSDAE